MPSLVTAISIGVVIFVMVMSILAVQLVQNNDRNRLNDKLYFAGYMRGEEAAQKCVAKGDTELMLIERRDRILELEELSEHYKKGYIEGFDSAWGDDK